MTTSALHFEVERSRFANLLLAALGAAVPATLASLLGRDRNESAVTPVDKTAVEAAAVREMARSYSKTDPSFAADLYAAADRHEAPNDE